MLSVPVSDHDRDGVNPCNLAQSAYRSAWAAWQRWADVADYLEARHAGGASPATICVVRAAATFPWDHNEARREAPGSRHVEVAALQLAADASMRPGAKRRDHLFVVGVVPPPRVHAAAVVGQNR